MNNKKTIHLTHLFFLFMVVGCGGPIYPVTSGFHALNETFGFGRTVNGRGVPLKPETVVIWASHLGVEHQLAGEFLKDGYTVVERGRLQQILNEQNFRIALSATADQLTEEIIKAGKLAGATLVVFAEIQRNPLDGHEVKSATATIRGVSIETGKIQWSGTASVKTDGFYVLNDVQEGALVRWALHRATCLTEVGWIWEEPSNSTTGGCRKKDFNNDK